MITRGYGTGGILTRGYYGVLFKIYQTTMLLATRIKTIVIAVMDHDSSI